MSRASNIVNWPSPVFQLGGGVWSLIGPICSDLPYKYRDVCRVKKIGVVQKSAWCSIHLPPFSTRKGRNVLVCACCQLKMVGAAGGQTMAQNREEVRVEWCGRGTPIGRTLFLHHRRNQTQAQVDSVWKLLQHLEGCRKKYLTNVTIYGRGITPPRPPGTLRE